MEKVLLVQVDPQGVGLAATQVGVGISLFIIKASKNAKAEVFINPRVIEHKAQSTKHDTDGKAKIPVLNDLGIPEQSEGRDPIGVKNAVSSFPKKQNKKQPLEGCLSIPRIWSPVVRAEKVVIEYQDLTGSTHKRTFTGLKSVIVQHEMDHLIGVLFTQRALEQNSQLYEEKAGKLKKIDY